MLCFPNNGMLDELSSPLDIELHMVCNATLPAPLVKFGNQSQKVVLNPCSCMIFQTTPNSNSWLKRMPP